MGVYKGQRPFSGRMLVVSVSFIIMLTLMAVLIHRLDREINTVERVQFEMRLAELQSAVMLVYASHVAKNKTNQAAEYIGMNPMRFLVPALSDRISVRTGEVIEQSVDQWPTYIGEYLLSEVNEKGIWVFDPELNVIAYRPDSRDWFTLEPEKEFDWLQFQVVGLWSEKGQRKELKGLELKALQEFSIRVP